MAIISAAATGIEVTTAAMNETLGSQTNQTGNNTVVVSNTLANVNNGNITAPTGYVGRLVLINQGGTEQVRRVTAEAATGTGTEVRLTVNEDWNTNPVSSDTIHVSYSSDDMEAFTGMSLNAKTGAYEGGSSREWAIGQGTNFAWVAFFDYTAWEIPDRGATEAGLEILNNGRVDMGYVQGGVGIQGGVITAIQGVNAELGIRVDSGGYFYSYASVFRSLLASINFDMNTGANAIVDGFLIKSFTDNLQLLDGVWTNGRIAGDGGTGELIEVATEGTYENILIAATAGLTTPDDDSVETITMRDIRFVDNIDYIVLYNAKTYDMINPVWDAVTNSDFNSTGLVSTDDATVNDRRSVDAVVQEADGTKLQNALVNVYENTQLADLVQKLTTDSNGVASGSFLYRAHVWTDTVGATTTYGGHALQCGKWLYRPFVSAQASDTKFDGTIVLAPDSNIVQTTQATAITDGSGITWSEPTNPTEIIDFNTGSGAAAVGMVLTFSPSGAVGTIRERASGNDTAGELYLDTRNATAIANGDTFSRTGGTAGTFSGTYVNDSKQPFTISINGNAKSLQVIYDYLAARQNETTLTADGELIWEWCRAAQTQPFYATGSAFYTERSNGKGVYVYNRGAGSLTYMTDDAGNTWTPPTSVTVQVTVTDSSTGSPIATNAHVYLEILSGHVEVLNSATNGSGVASTPYNYTTDQPVVGWVREMNLSGTDYTPKNISGTITSAGLTLSVELDPVA